MANVISTSLNYKDFLKFILLFEKFDNFCIKMEAMKRHPLVKTYFLFRLGRP